jgi:hypothetical protein
MKKLLLTAAAMLAAVGVYAQGTVNFANIGVGVNSPFKDIAGVNLTGAGYSVELLAGASAGSLASVVILTPTFSAGYFNGGSQTLGFVGPGFFQVRVWDNQGGTLTTYAAAVGAAGRVAESGALGITPTAPATPPGTPAPLVGLPTLQLAQVPEPSTIALGLLGAAALLVVRRRK